MKKILLFIALFGCSSPRSEMNEINLKKININMHIKEVNKIMGIPSSINIDYFRNDEYDFRYTAPSKYEDDFHIFISRKDSLVIRIADGN